MDRVYRGVLDFYTAVDVKTGKCQQLQYNDSENQGNTKENNNEMSEFLNRYINKYKPQKRG